MSTPQKKPTRHTKCFDSLPMKKPQAKDRQKLQIVSIQSPKPRASVNQAKSRVKFNECYCDTLERTALLEQEQRNLILNSELESLHNRNQISNICRNDEISTKYDKCKYPLPEFYFNYLDDFLQGYDKPDSECSQFYTPLPSLSDYKQWLSDIMEFRRRNWKECHANSSFM